MTNIKFFYLLVAITTIWLGFDINSGRIRWGTAYLNDSTSATITTNKGFLVNGTLSTNLGDVKISNSYKAYVGDPDDSVVVWGEINEMLLAGNKYTFKTYKGRSSLMELDSATGLDLNYGKIILGSTIIQTGTGTPEGAVTAPVGSLFLRTDNANSFYVKQTGSGNTGWILK